MPADDAAPPLRLVPGAAGHGHDHAADHGHAHDPRLIHVPGLSLLRMSVPARLAGAEESKNAPKQVQDAVSALVNLGYGRPQSAAAVAAALKALGETAEAPALIRRGLKELAG